MGAAILIDVAGETSRADLLASGAQTVTVNGTGVSLSNFIGKVAVTQGVGAVTGTSPTLAGKIQTSPDNSTWTDLSGATFASATAAGVQTINVDTRAASVYIRYVGTIGGTTPSFTMHVSMVGQKQVQA